jgi:NADPH-dependent curcumin reductase
MNQTINRQVRLRSRPSAIRQAEHFEILEAMLSGLGPGQVLARNICLSVEPAMRGWPTQWATILNL